MLSAPSTHTPEILPVRTSNGAFGRICGLAARLTEAPMAALLSGPHLSINGAFGPASAVETELRRIIQVLRPSVQAGAAEWVEDAACDERFGHTLIRFILAVPVRTADGHFLGVLAAAAPEPSIRNNAKIRHLRDLAALAATELDLDRRRNRLPAEGPDRRRTQEQLLEKTLELAKVGEDLRHLHRLSTTNYPSIDQLFSDYLATGRAIFGLNLGVVIQVRGRYAAIRAIQSERALLRSGATIDLDQVFCGVVASEGKTAAAASVADDPRFGGRPHYGPAPQSCYIGAPILVEGEVFGVISFSSPHPRWRGFSSHEIELIELMAKSIGRSILEDEMQAAREGAEALEQDRSQVLELVAKDRPLAEILGQVARMVERQSPALSVAIHVVRQGRLHCASAPSMPEAYRRRAQGMPAPMQAGCCFSAVFTRSTEIFPASRSRCAMSESGCTHEFCWQACGASPVLSGSGEVLGVVIAYWRLAVRPWHVQAELLEMASHLAAIAIEHRTLTDRLAYQAEHDALTGLANRELLARELKRRTASSEPVAVVFIDLDRFKQINDHLGHATGDAVLRCVARRIEGSLRTGELAARPGGDEFVALLSGSCGREEAHRRAQAILDAVREPILHEGRQVYVTASVGVSFHPEAGQSAEALLGNADLAMYQVKASGRNDVRCSMRDPEDDHMARLELEHSLRHALDRNEFVLNFQPIYDIQGGVTLTAFEVLLGWNHPALGRVAPQKFIPIAEECGMIGPIGAWVLRMACRQAAEWRRLGLPPVRISVNVSALQFGRSDFPETVCQTLEEAGIDADWLQLELTESAIMEDVDRALPKLQRLRNAGVRLALDDFGTGYSSLGYLRWLPVECLKIDRSFLAEAGNSHGSLHIIYLILSMAHHMGLSVVAEGVESERQYQMLREAGCDSVQGHLFGGALAAEEVEHWLAGELQAVV